MTERTAPDECELRRGWQSAPADLQTRLCNRIERLQAENERLRKLLAKKKKVRVKP